MAKYHNKSIVWDGVWGQKVPNLKLCPPPHQGVVLDHKWRFGFFGRALEIDIAPCFEKTRKIEIGDCYGGEVRFSGQKCLLSGVQIGVGSCGREEFESSGAAARMSRRGTVDF